MTVERLSRWKWWFRMDTLLWYPILYVLFWTNLAGTVYGFMWYGDQLEYTAAHRPIWTTLLVPDSPTASMFFTLSIWFLLRDQKKGQAPHPELYPQNPGERAKARWRGAGRSIIDTMGTVTSIKYGVWAVAMIAAGAAKGDTVGWQDYMLSGSHLGMAIEALLFIRFLRIRPAAIILVAAWTLFNDWVDYGMWVFPWLPDDLMDSLSQIEVFTIWLSFVSLLLTYFFYQSFRKRAV